MADTFNEEPIVRCDNCGEAVRRFNSDALNYAALTGAWIHSATNLFACKSLNSLGNSHAQVNGRGK